MSAVQPFYGTTAYPLSRLTLRPAVDLITQRVTPTARRTFLRFAYEHHDFAHTPSVVHLTRHSLSGTSMDIALTPNDLARMLIVLRRKKTSMEIQRGFTLRHAPALEGTSFHIATFGWEATLSPSQGNLLRLYVEASFVAGMKLF